jgi:hypothetical protein
MLEEVYMELDKFENYIMGNLIHQQNELDYWISTTEKWWIKMRWTSKLWSSFWGAGH